MAVPRGASWEKRAAILALREEKAPTPHLRHTLHRATDALRKLGVKWPLLVDRETHLVGVVREYFQRAERMSRAQPHPRKRKHALHMSKVPDVAAGALLSLALRNDTVLQGRVRVHHVTAALLPEDAAPEDVARLQSRICRLMKNLTRNGFNAREADRAPLAQFDASIHNFCAEYRLPAQFSALATRLMKECIEGVWLRGKYPPNAEGGVLLFLLRRVFSEEEGGGGPWDLPAKQRKRLQREFDPETLTELVCDYLQLHRRAVLNCA